MKFGGDANTIEELRNLNHKLDQVIDLLRLLVRYEGDEADAASDR